MRCQKCGLENPPGKIVCSRCGTRLRQGTTVAPTTPEHTEAFMTALRADLIRLGVVTAMVVAGSLLLGMVVR
ncbi:MAG: zinc ribbon domain-containing protein [Armatimonadetes bacterium]|nr:zinc ribbon domain-containing protein [Armatimonadota bacterium]